MIIKKFASRAQLHDKVKIVLVIVGLKVLYDVWMVYRIENLYLSHDLFQAVLKGDFVEDFDGYERALVFFSVGFVDLAEGPSAYDLCLAVDNVVLS